MKNRNRYRVLATLGLASLVQACSTASILGVWEAVDTGTGSYYFAHYAYLEDGRKCTVLFKVLDSGVKMTVFLNTWELDDGILTITYGPSSGSIPEGYSSKSRIDEISSTRLTYTLVESDYALGNKEFNVRLKSVDPNRVCDVVYEVLDLPSPDSESAEMTTKNLGTGKGR